MVRTTTAAGIAVGKAQPTSRQNAYWQHLDFELPPIANHASSWRRWIDTSSDSPLDISPWDEAPALSDCSYRVAPRSVVVLFEKIGPQRAGG